MIWLFLPQSNNLEKVSIVSKWVNTDLIENRLFIEIWQVKFHHRCVSFQVKYENQM